jgi:hypothetical protein
VTSLARHATLLAATAAAWSGCTGMVAAAAADCFGAAARDPQNTCSAPTASAVPAPLSTTPEKSAECTPTADSPLTICTFGAAKSRAGGHIALVGDSHALHWRTAVDHVARANRWHAFSITAPACFFSEAVHELHPGLRGVCEVYYREVHDWLRDHPEVSTMFVSQNALTPVTVPAGKSERGRSYGEIKVAGFQKAWRKLPRTVKHIVVIRDTPLISDERWECLLAAVADGTRPPGEACPILRAFAIRWDTAVTAAAALHSRRYQSVDLTSYFCDRKDCYPVIGGVLVYRDPYGHITETYAKSLGPFLLRKVRRLMARW